MGYPWDPSSCLTWYMLLVRMSFVMCSTNQSTPITVQPYFAAIRLTKIHASLNNVASDPQSCQHLAGGWNPNTSFLEPYCAKSEEGFIDWLGEFPMFDVGRIIEVQADCQCDSVIYLIIHWIG